MRLPLFVLFASILFANVGSAAVDLLPQFKNKWEGRWAIETENEDTFYRAQTSENITPSLIEYTPKDTLSLEQKYLFLRLRVNSLKSWGGIEIRLSSDEAYKNYYAVQIPFYSDEEFNLLQPQQWADYTITLGEAKIIGKPNRKKIRHIGIYIQGQSAAPDSVFAVDFANISIRSSFHRGIVSMTFDDGYAEQFQAAEIMSRSGLRGTAYVMTNEIDDPGYLTSEQLKIMGDQFHWGISAHHAKPITQMSEEEFKKEMESTFDFLKNLNRGNEIYHFAYPLGKQSRVKTLPWIQQTFLTARVAGGGAETLPPSDWRMLKTFNVTPDITAKQLLERVKKADENNEWLILMFHKFTSEATSEDALVYPFSEFEKFCKGLQKVGLPVHPVHEVYEAFHE